MTARLPYVVKHRLGFTLLSMPPLTQTLGPWLRSTEAKYANDLSQQMRLNAELIKQLPRHDLFLHRFSPAVTNWLPYYWAGFRATIAYTYRLESLSRLDDVWLGVRENVRREIRKAEKVVSIRDDLGIDAFLTVWNKTFERQGIRAPYDAQLIRRLDDACAGHQARRVLFAQDARGAIHAAAYIVWDGRVAYYLMGGGDPDLRTSGATSLVMWEAIKFASQVAAVFDFEGSMLQPVERFFRSFGARQVPYLIVSRASYRMRALLSLSSLFRALLGRHADFPEM